MVRQAAAVNGAPCDDQDQDRDDEAETDAEAAENSASSPDVPPMLLGVILAANPDESSAARRATVRLERIGRQIQESWAAEGDQPLS
ncbi:hypothetical protein MAPG_03884 [Magnaporthiopsis poae ATCC 64411]|uniref:Uncharacterized protein n=1 Tax=Magnaporthiopsis poae (strain ATCC 64411 / 73-15) TaxID=644358 RepID=A0A0C4DV84_MAGP6|nr:hypothetical protein MAPG_03884 [Magnaporthiopsis poae ATCC 64411]